MERRRVPVAVTVGAVVLVALLTGPVVNLGGFPPEGTGSAVGAESGTAEVRVVSAPDALGLTAGRFGAEVYYLTGTEATVAVEGVTGAPTLVYTVESRALGFKGVQRTALAGSAGERVGIAVPVGRFGPDAVTREEYAATLTVAVHGEETRTVLERTVTVRVSG